LGANWNSVVARRLWDRLRVADASSR